jgi:type II secretory pathway component PulC
MLATRTLTPVALAFLVACGGVSEERVNALEAQIKQLQGAVSETGESDPRIATLDQRITEVGKTSSTSIESMQKVLEVLQDEVAKMSSTAEPTDEADAAADANTIFGAESVPVVANGDTFEIDKRWLIRELRALAVTGKGPKFSAGKKGVVIRGFKPKSLFDKLGIKNGDAIITVNGAAVTSAAELATAIQKRANPTTVELERKRKPLNVTFKVVN